MADKNDSTIEGGIKGDRNAETKIAGKKTPSPYDLSSHDNPGSVITQVQLRGENYDEWAKAMKTSLRARRKWGFVEGNIKQPEEGSTEMEDWWTVQSMLVSWILNTIDPTLRSTISYMENAKELWEDIKERFSIVNGPRIQQLKSDLAQCKQEGMAMVNYYGKLKMLWDELANYQQIPICTCSGCKCGIKSKLEKQREEERVHQFLMGLDDVLYGTVRSNLLATDPLPSLNRIYATLIQEERVKSIARTKEERGEVVGLAVQTAGRARGRGDMKEKNAVCSYCNRTGHDALSCFQVVGYPDWWGDRPRNETKMGAGRGKGQQQTRGSNQGRGRSTIIRANAVQTNEGGPVVTNADASGLTGLSSEQWQTLVELLNTHKGSNTERMTGKNTIWIVDTGASNHMTGNVRFLHKMKSVQGCPVGLPNGEQAAATQEESVILEGGLQLNNVLYVPGLNCNLISVSQLIDDMDCVCQFTNSLCIMQDRTSKTLIGVGERRDGLYHFRGIRHEKVCKVGDMSLLHLWHKRMGHPSMKISQLISNVGKNKSVIENKACDVCQRAKQTRDSFPLSDHKASSSFELVHCDLWGPYKTPSSCGAYYFLTIVDDFSRAVWIYLLLDKREVSQTILSFIALVDRQYEKQIKIIRSDNGTEFTCLKTEFIKRGIIFQTSCVGTPQQNGRVERKHRHILNIARALRFQSNLPISFWGECVLTAGYLINRTPTPLLDGKTPYEMLNGQPPSYEHLKVFGSLCYAHNQGRKGDKFTSRSKKCVFVGYPPGKKGWKLFDLDNKNYFVSRDVAFFENEFPFASIDKISSEPTQIIENENYETQSAVSEHQELPLEVEISELRGGTDEENVQEVGTSQVLQQDDEHEEISEEDLGRGKRVKNPSVKLNGYVTYNVQKNGYEPIYEFTPSTAEIRCALSHNALCEL